MSEMKLTDLEKEMLSLFKFGINCLSERRIIKFKFFKKIEKLLVEGKINIKIKSE